MRKMLVVASSELSSAVRTKAFIIGVAAMPVIVGIAIVLQLFLEDRADTRKRSVAVIDQTGVLYDVIEARARERNSGLVDSEGRPTRSHFLPSPVEFKDRSLEELRLELSDRVRSEELFAFVEIPAAVVDESRSESVLYYSDHPTYMELRHWLREILGDEIRKRRFQAHDIEKDLVEKLSRGIRVENLGLAARGEEDEEVKEAERIDEVRTMGVPAILMFLLFFVLMGSAPQLLNSVLEEKMSRISEVLLGSVTPFQLMMGKLLGSMGVSAVLAGLYIGGGFLVAAYYGYADAVPLPLFLWFVLFLALAAFLFGSIFIAIGSACTDIKDAQSLMMPAMILVMIPMFTWMHVLQSPSSGFSVGLSLFPPATPMLMLLRVAVHPGPPFWQILLSVALTGATTIICVWAAGKIFRTGILMQGKSASLREMWRWLRT